MTGPFAVLQRSGQSRPCAFAHNILGHLDRLAQKFEQALGNDLK